MLVLLYVHIIAKALQFKSWRSRGGEVTEMAESSKNVMPSCGRKMTALFCESSMLLTVLLLIMHAAHA